MAIDEAEFAENPEPRCPVLLLLDTSFSMREEGRIEALQEGIRMFRDEVAGDNLASLRIEVSVVTFGEKSEQVTPFTPILDFEPPVIKASGTTPMGSAISLGLASLEERKAAYRESGILYYRPWVFLITDGEPTDQWKEAAQQVHQGEKDGKFLFYAVGVKSANFTRLAEIAPPNRGPLQLKGIAFKEMFQWLSASVKAVSTSALAADGQQKLPPVTGWGEVPTL
ncbi:MAG: VWA domain-containing protein [Planctomycetota bacterium]|nr:MAG: VWA domain-containing protein [Planctomycetota bacterium]